MSSFTPKTSQPALGGSGTEHAAACAADHATAAVQIGECKDALAQAGLGVIGGTWYFGHGLPSDSIGKDGDLYLNQDTADVYAKENGTWA